MKRRVRTALTRSLDRSSLVPFLEAVLADTEGRLETLTVHSEPAAPEHRVSFTAVFVSWED